jgi:hypothetical protein
MRSRIHFTRGRLVRQARVGLGELKEEHLRRHGFAGPGAMLYRTDGPNEARVFATEFGPLLYEPGDLCDAPQGNHLSPDARRCGEPIAGRRSDAADPVVRARAGRKTYPGRSDRAAGTGRCGSRLAQTGRMGATNQAQGAHTSIFYRNNSLNVVGWMGDLSPLKLNIRDIRPIMSDRIHLAPSSWVTFEGRALSCWASCHRLPWPI